jgi:hypothetical protein
VEPGTRRPLGRPQDRRAEQEEADRNESIPDVKHKNETIGEGAVAGPARKARGLQHAGNYQHHAGHG